MTEQTIEQEIQDAGKTAPRVTPARIDSIIVGEHYFTAADGVQGDYAKKAERYSPIPVPESLCLLTFCVLKLANGFTVTGDQPAPPRKTSTQRSAAKSPERMRAIKSGNWKVICSSSSCTTPNAHYRSSSVRGFDNGFNQTTGANHGDYRDDSITGNEP